MLWSVLNLYYIFFCSFDFKNQNSSVFYILAGGIFETGWDFLLLKCLFAELELYTESCSNNKHTTDEVSQNDYSGVLSSLPLILTSDTVGDFHTLADGFLKCCYYYHNYFYCHYCPW